MAKMLFAKFNINSDIYEVYKGNKKLDDILSDIYVSINDKTQIIEHFEGEDARFKFITLNKKDDLIVYGRIAYIYKDTHTTYDEELDNIVDETDHQAAQYITFYFDMRKEIIAFTPKRYFGHQMFLKMFKLLIEACCENKYAVEIFLEKNSRHLEDKLNKFSYVSNVKVILIPPNSDKEEYDDLFNSSSKEIMETNATKFEISLQSGIKKGIDIFSIYIKKMIKSAMKGYGEVSISGKDNSNKKYQLTSNEHVPYKKNINDNVKDNLVEFPEVARSGIIEMLIEKEKE